MNKIYSCNDHVEEAIEEAIEDGGLPPELEKVTEDFQDKKTCFICDSVPIYIVEKHAE